MPGATHIDKLDNMRKGLHSEKASILAAVARQAEEKETAIPMPVDIDAKENRWDCETILSTYSNLENHPKLIMARSLTRRADGPKFKVDRRTGLPMVEELSTKSSLEDDEDTEDSDNTSKPIRKAATGRPADESKDEKRARKQVIKAEKQQRRQEKKSRKTMFADEFKHQKMVKANKPLPMKKL